MPEWVQQELANIEQAFSLWLTEEQRQWWAERILRLGRPPWLKAPPPCCHRGTGRRPRRAGRR
jgi:hypothetical protein